MSKYDSLKLLKETKARKSRPCDKCGRSIENGGTYYKESVGKVNVPGLILRGFCVGCYQEDSNKLLTKKL